MMDRHAFETRDARAIVVALKKSQFTKEKKARSLGTYERPDPVPRMFDPSLGELQSYLFLGMAPVLALMSRILARQDLE